MKFFLTAALLCIILPAVGNAQENRNSLSADVKLELDEVNAADTLVGGKDTLASKDSITGPARIVFSQFSGNYQPITFTGKFPYHLIKGINITSVQKQMDELMIDEELRVDFVNYNRYFLSELLKSGKVLFNDSLSSYVKHVGNNLFENTPGVWDHFHVFVYKDEFPNAFSTSHGFIFFSTALLKTITSEAQLAFIIAHEVSHDVKGHMLVRLKRSFNQDNLHEKGATIISGTLHHLRYSREHEFEADAMGLKIIAKSPYNAYEALPALQVFNPNDTVYALKTNLTDYLYLDSATKAKALAAEKKGKKFKLGDYDDYSYKDKNELEDDRYLSHPAIDKRVLSLREQLRQMRYDSIGKAHNLYGDTLLAYIKTIAEFEMVGAAFKDNNYGNSMFTAMRLLDDYPHNIYLQSTVVESLYWISYYKELNRSGRVLESSHHQYPKLYDSLYNSIKSLGYNDLRLLSYNYTREMLDSLPNTEQLLFHMAYVTDSFLGLDAARHYYRQYIERYPQGRYRNFAQHKIR